MEKNEMENDVFLSAEKLMKLAAEKTGLDDWGDSHFIEPLNRLVESFERDQKPNQAERTVFIQECVSTLESRLKIQEDLKRFPEILDVKIQKPIFVMGLGRTGTTLLHNLLSQDPSSRYLAFWELISPSPPPDVINREKDPRIRMCQLVMRMMNNKNQKARQIHEITPTSPEECSWALQNTFMFRFANRWKVNTYAQWLLTQDLTPAYQYYAKILQMLTWKCPGERIVLKSPSHIMGISAILKVFPDANILWNHRNLSQVIPSLSSLRSTSLPLDFSKNEIAEDVLWWSTYTVIKGIEMRDEENPARFYDVHFEELVEKPVETVQKIYEYFGLSYPSDMNLRIKDWLLKNPRNKHGVHQYSMEEYGLTSEKIHRAFAYYSQRFGVACK